VCTNEHIKEVCWMGILPFWFLSVFFDNGLTTSVPNYIYELCIKITVWISFKKCILCCKEDRIQTVPKVMGDVRHTS